MLSYRHSFHAGNYADVLKHVTLQQILIYLTQKNKPVHYIDSHAGAGGYQLTSKQAEKTGEYQLGIGKLFEQTDKPALLQDYCQLVRSFNSEHSQRLKHYPGSPWIAAQCLREQDKLFLYELHPQDHLMLSELFASDRRVKIGNSDGFKGTLVHVPPVSRRGLVLIDPPYEVKTDYDKVVTLIEQVHKRFATGCIALWYPVVERWRINALEQAIKATGIANVQLFELAQQRDTAQFGMTASGMIVVNPPWTLKSQLEGVLPYLSELLGQNNQGSYRIKQLSPEA
ncbi:23S rRNA (adenine(2030)-N(6))-methyltransferase RlmJ [Celerinatantimonas yamalensis]|uniref:Ribosomal RNA large subunit methyltransferase J n=1 Tax=Celerinatantimonas yamalensis TaxID=559956 RepID=A0ABW9G4K6_9GAMM